MCRPRALMIPWLTECIRPKGLPRASTQLPTGGLVAVAHPRRRQVVAVELQHGDVGLLVAPDLGRQERPAVVQEDPDLRGLAHSRRRGGWSGHKARGRDRSGRSRPTRSPRNCRSRRPSSARMVFCATMCTTVGETALATSSNVRSIWRNCSYCLASSVVDRIILAVGLAPAGLRRRIGGRSAALGSAPRRRRDLGRDGRPSPRQHDPQQDPGTQRSQRKDERGRSRQHQRNSRPARGFRAPERAAGPRTSPASSTFALICVNILPAARPSQSIRAVQGRVATSLRAGRGPRLSGASVRNVHL